AAAVPASRSVRRCVPALARAGRVEDSAELGHGLAHGAEDTIPLGKLGAERGGERPVLLRLGARGGELRLEPVQRSLPLLARDVKALERRAQRLQLFALVIEGRERRLEARGRDRLPYVLRPLRGRKRHEEVLDRIVGLWEFAFGKRQVAVHLRVPNRQKGVRPLGWRSTFSRKGHAIASFTVVFRFFLAYFLVTNRPVRASR